MVRDQEEAGIDIVTDGEQTRRHFVTTFLEALDGVDFEHRKTVRIRNRYDAAVPMVVGPVARRGPVFVDAARFLRGATQRKVKVTLPGPMTMVDTLYDAHYRSREKLAWAFAEILNDEAREIEAAGIDVIQFDEPAFNVYFDEVRDWGVRTLERAAQGLRCTTAVHICYGYGIKANIDWKKTLGAEWRQYEQTFPLLARSSIGQVSLECANSHVPIDLIALLEGKDVLVGAIDVATDRIETAEDVAATITQALAPRADRAALSVHQLRDGAARPGRRPRQAPGARGGRGAGSGQRLGTAGPLAPSLHGGGQQAPSAPKTPLADPQKTTSIWPSRRVSSAKCFSFKAVSTPLYDRFASFHRRSFLEIETLAGSRPDFFFVRGEILKWQLEL